jgi:DNA-binding MarR family transcriptional regulator
MEVKMDDLFDWAKARTSDPDTSHGAAASLTEGKLSRLHARIILCLLRADLTTTEIGQNTQTDRDTISPRMPTLVAGGWVEDSGDRRVPIGKRRPSIVWALTPKGREITVTLNGGET